LVAFAGQSRPQKLTPQTAAATRILLYLRYLTLPVCLYLTLGTSFLTVVRCDSARHCARLLKVEVPRPRHSSTNDIIRSELSRLPTRRRPPSSIFSLRRCRRLCVLLPTKKNNNSLFFPSSHQAWLHSAIPCPARPHFTVFASIDQYYIII
jgi:hypothetical protein